MNAPGKLRDASSMTADERKAATKDATDALAAKLKATIKPDLTAHEKRVLEAITKATTEGMFDQGRKHGEALGEARSAKHFWRGVVSGALGGLGVCILTVWLIGGTLGGIAIQGITADRVFDRFESQQQDLNQKLDEQTR